MKQTTARTHPQLTKRLGILPVPVMLSAALIVGACSSGNETPGAAATNDTPVSTTADMPATDAGGPGESTPGSTGPTSTTASDVEAFLDQLETRGFGGVIAVRDGSDITTRAYGIADRENGVPIDAETVFDIGSLTKQFTAAAILRLEMDGRLSVEDTLGEHVPGLPDDKAAITLHQLLTHTAGVPHNVGADDESIGRGEFLALVGETALTAEPGEGYEYSNVGYALLAAVIESETGEPYEAYLRRALFEPAGMLDTGYVLPDWDDHTIAVGYDDASGERFGRPNERSWDADGPYWNLHGNGGILSTAADMLRWDEALLGDQVLDATAKAKFFAPHVPDGPDEEGHYGYGWSVVPTPMGTPLITHNGGNGVFYADFLRFVEQDVTIFVSTNSDRVDDRIIAYEVANHVLDGELAAVLSSDSDSDSGIDGDTGSGIAAAVRRCGFDDLSIDSLPEYPVIEALPDSPAGRTARAFLDLLTEGDAATRLDFVVATMTEELIGDDPMVIVDGIAELQDQLAGYQVARVLQQDDHRLHLLMQGPSSDLLLSVGLDEVDPERLACLAVSP